ncbi:MAG: anti-sigma factor antagonist [Eubacteriaceae bacterium]|nr:anti-sigma factor antagonist [Eubacteriaceae bacterium]
MDYKIQSMENILLISVKGELDDHAAKAVREKADSALCKKELKHLIFDFSELALMDSAGIGLIMGRYRLIRPRQGKTAIICKNDSVRKILKMSGLFKLFKCYSDFQEAYDYLTKESKEVTI